MYAIIADGGRQYQVQEGQELDIDYRQSATTGDSLVFDRVLSLSQPPTAFNWANPTWTA